MLWPSWPGPAPPTPTVADGIIPSWSSAGHFSLPRSELGGTALVYCWELGHCAQAGAPGVAQEGRIHGEPDAPSSGRSSPAAIPACPTAQPCPHCPLMARVNRVWCEVLSEGPQGEHPEPHSARVSQHHGIVRTNPGTDAKPLGEELVPALPYLSELEFGMFTSVYIAQPFPGRKGELHGAIAVSLLCQTPHPLPARLRIGTNCPSWTFLGCEW